MKHFLNIWLIQETFNAKIYFGKEKKKVFWFTYSLLGNHGIKNGFKKS